jgi:hypothetical protein
VTLCSFVLPIPAIPGLDFSLPSLPAFPPSLSFDLDLPGIPPLPIPAIPGLDFSLPALPAFPPDIIMVCPLDA